MADVRRERIPSLWSTIEGRELAKGLIFTGGGGGGGGGGGDEKYPCIRVSAEKRSCLE